MNPTIYYRSFIIACLLFALSRAHAQTDRQPLVTVHLKDTSMAEILKELELQSGLRFYYDTADLDTTKLSIQADQQSLAKVLGDKGIPNRVDDWGPAYEHDWPTWWEMLPLYLDDLVP